MAVFSTRSGFEVARAAPSISAEISRNNTNAPEYAGRESRRFTLTDCWACELYLRSQQRRKSWKVGKKVGTGAPVAHVGGTVKDANFEVGHASYFCTSPSWPNGRLKGIRGRTLCIPGNQVHA